MVYVYPATVVGVVDADTVALEVDLGFSVYHRGPFRLAGCAGREKRDPGGPDAVANLASILLPGGLVTIRSMKPDRPIPPDKYAPRWDALVFLPDGTDLVRLLIAGNWLVAWDGRGPQPKPPWPRPA